jgi:LysR family glycine cleavage system transcriptional activator
MKWLIPRLPRFLDAHPGVRVRIIESHEAVAFTGAAQAAIRIGDADRPDFAVLPFMNHWQGPVLSPELLARTDGSLAAILALPRLYPETFRQGWTTWAERVGVVLPEVGAEREFEHNSYMLEAAAAGLGVAITAWAFAQSEVDRGRLAAPFGFEPVAEGFIYLRPKRDRDPMAEAFGRWLVEEGTRSPKP